MTAMSEGSQLNANLGLKVNRIITFSSIQIIFTAFFCVYGDY